MNNYCIRVAWRDAAKQTPWKLEFLYFIDVMTMTIKRCTCYHPFSTLWKIQEGFDDELNFAHRCQWLEDFQPEIPPFRERFPSKQRRPTRHGGKRQLPCGTPATWAKKLRWNLTGLPRFQKNENFCSKSLGCQNLFGPIFE